MEPPGPRGPYRKLAPGVMHVVPPDRQVEESVTRHNVVELLAIDAEKFKWAENVPFRRKVGVLEFRFKPVRIVDVDLPQASGKMQRKPIWYLLYSVTNRGKVMQSKEQPDGTFKPDFVDEPMRFMPAFLFESITTNKWYPDRVIPAAMGPIRLREDPNRQLYNSVEIIRDLKPGETVWGVATWEDIDPRTDRFAIYVTGLTNAYRWTDAPGRYKKGDPLGAGRRLEQKALKLNFWRPGNDRDVDESQIRLGIPDRPDYEWVYLGPAG